MRYASESGDIIMAFTGETMLTRPLQPYQEHQFLAVREQLLTADVRFTNAEMLFHNYEHPPASLYGMHMRCDPMLLMDLRWFGINLVSCGNNHAYDFGQAGVLTNMRNLDAAGLIHAGTGRNYAEAAAPAYLETPRGRVGLVSATTSGHLHGRAGEQRRDVGGRPGVNLIRWINEWTVDADVFAALQRMAAEFQWSQGVPAWFSRAYREVQDPTRVMLAPDRNSLGVNTEDPAACFILGTTFERHTCVHQADLERNIKSIRDARRMADWVIFSLHSHEGGRTNDEPADHVIALAHAAVDVGADVVVGHGAHIDRGIEIYEGKPVFYGLGGFILQHDSLALMPHDSMVLYGFGHEDSVADLSAAFFGARRGQTAPDPHDWSVVPFATFKGGHLESLILQPIELGVNKRAGRPMLADGPIARAALERVCRLSAALNTTIEIQDARGVVVLKDM